MDGGVRHAGAPRTLDVQQFANARGAEVQSLYAVLKSNGQEKQEEEEEGGATGGPPRHLRRRTTSHSRRRSFFWQRKYKMLKVGEVDVAETENKNEGSAENGADVEGESQQEKKEKLPCRRVRRRIELKGDESGGGGCASDGTQRLVTHVWHAKRFTMTKIWGHWLAEGLPGSGIVVSTCPHILFSNSRWMGILMESHNRNLKPLTLGRGRGSRSVIQWVQEDAVLQDASFYCPIELQGSSDAILEVLQLVMEPVPRPVESMSENDRAVFRGIQYGKAMLHHVGRFPHGLIAPITYMWRPVLSGPRGKRQMWVWVHAAAFEEASSCLLAVCQKLGGTENDKVEFWSRKGELGRLDILGANADIVLRKVLHPVVRKPSQEASSEDPATFSTCTASTVLGLLERACESYGNAIFGMDVWDPRDPPHLQMEFQPSLISDQEVGEGSVVEMKDTCPSPVKVEDLGAHLADITHEIPHKEVEVEEAGWSSWLEGQLSDSPRLWSSHPNNAGLGMAGRPLTQKDLSTRRHKKRLAFFQLGKRAATSQEEVGASNENLECPILLLKHEHQNLSACGYSLIMPIAWVRSFWVPLVFAGGHAIGLRERHWLYTDASLPSFPHDYPDCSAYNQYMAKQAEEKQDLYKKKPPSKRGLYPKLDSLWQFAVGATSPKVEGSSQVESSSSPKFIPMTPTDAVVSIIPEGSSQSVSDALEDQALGGLTMEGVAAADFTPIADVAHKLAGKGQATDSSMCVVRTGFALRGILRDTNLHHLPIHPEGDYIGNDLQDEGQAYGLDEHDFTKYLKKGCLVRVLIRAPRKGVFDAGAIIYLPTSTDYNSYHSMSQRWQGFEDHSFKQIPQHFLSKKKKLAEKEKARRAPSLPEQSHPLEGPLQAESNSPQANFLNMGKQTCSLRTPIGIITSPLPRGSTSRSAVGICEVASLGLLRAIQMTDKRWQGTSNFFLLARDEHSSMYRPVFASIPLESGPDLD